MLEIAASFVQPLFMGAPPIFNHCLIYLTHEISADLHRIRHKGIELGEIIYARQGSCQNG